MTSEGGLSPRSWWPQDVHISNKCLVSSMNYNVKPNLNRSNGNNVGFRLLGVRRTSTCGRAVSSYDPRARAHKQIQQEATMKSTLITAHLHWLHVQFIIYICIFMFLFSLMENQETWSRSFVGPISTGPSTSERMKWFISLQTVSEVITIFTLEYHMDMTCISWWHLPPFLSLPPCSSCLSFL